LDTVQLGVNTVTGATTGRNTPRQQEPVREVPLDRLLKPDFPVRGRRVLRRRSKCAEVGDPKGERPPSRWAHLSEVVHLDPETYVPQEVVPDEVLTRMYADRGRPRPIPDRPAPEPETNEEDFFNDPGTWEFREELRECPTCGQPFLANAHNHRYCSEACAQEGRSITRICPECGEEFFTERREQVYCSLACSGRAKRNPENDRRCLECGGIFHATRRQQRFCSRLCARLWRRRERDG